LTEIKPQQLAGDTESIGTSVKYVTISAIEAVEDTGSLDYPEFRDLLAIPDKPDRLLAEGNIESTDYFKWYVNGDMKESGIGKAYLDVTFSGEEVSIPVRVEVYQFQGGPIIAEGIKVVKTTLKQRDYPLVFIQTPPEKSYYERESTGFARDEYTFKAITNNCPSGTVISWEFEDGINYEGSSIKHTWSTAGKKRVPAIAFWQRGPGGAGNCKVSIDIMIKEPPSIRIVGSLGAGEKGQPGQKYHFGLEIDGIPLSQLDWFDYIVNWQIGDSRILKNKNSIENIVFDSGGVYEIQAQLCDKDFIGWESARASLVFEVADNGQAVIYITGPNTCDVNTEQTFSVSATNIPNEAKYEWYFAGGNGELGKKYTGVSVQHTWKTEGEKNIRVQVTTGDNINSIAFDEIKVSVVSASKYNVRILFEDTKGQTGYYCWITFYKDGQPYGEEISQENSSHFGWIGEMEFASGHYSAKIKYAPVIGTKETTIEFNIPDDLTTKNLYNDLKLIVPGI
jgi:hypothetical protein